MFVVSCRTELGRLRLSFADLSFFFPSPALSKRWKSPKPSTSTRRTLSQVESNNGTTTMTEPQTIRTRSSIQTNLLPTSRISGTGVSSTTVGISPRLEECSPREGIDSTGQSRFFLDRLEFDLKLTSLRFSFVRSKYTILLSGHLLQFSLHMEKPFHLRSHRISLIDAYVSSFSGIRRVFRCAS